MNLQRSAGNRAVRSAIAVQRVPDPTAPKTVAFGSKGPAIEEVQQHLNRHGAAPALVVDGIFGPLTKAATKAFQVQKKLGPDGVIGPLTWRALQAEAASALPAGATKHPRDEATEIFAKGDAMTPAEASRAQALLMTLKGDEFRSVLKQAMASGAFLAMLTKLDLATALGTLSQLTQEVVVPTTLLKPATDTIDTDFKRANELYNPKGIEIERGVHIELSEKATKYGGAGGDFLYDAILMEELAWIRAHGLMLSLHSDICMPYLKRYANAEQKTKYLPRTISGEMILGIAMTEPGAGSDLANIQTRALRDGDVYLLNGAKTFISNGQIGDLFIVVAKTDPAADPPHRGISLLLVEGDTPGFQRGRKLDKLGLKGQDTSELFFKDCRVPAANLLGREGQGFKMLMEQLQQERLCIAIASVASCRRALADTLDYVKQRTAFGQRIAAFQNTQFKLVELATEVEVGQAFVDKLLAAHVRGDDIVMEVSMAKFWTTDLQKRLTSECLQLHGGYGFMLEYPIAGDYADAAVQSIYAGSNEIMKVIVARRLGLD